jgi:hypothetical protein
MENKYFDFGEFVSSVFAVGPTGMTHEGFLSSLFEPFFQKGESYEFDKSTSSRIINHKLDLPRKITKKVISHANDEKAMGAVADYLRSAIGEEKIYAVCKGISDSIGADTTIDSKEKKKIASCLSSGDYDGLIRKSFVMACSVSNRPTRRDGLGSAKPKREEWKSFFFLSQTEKDREAKRFVDKILRPKSRLSIKDFREMEEILCYTDLDFSHDEKKRICLSFLKSWSPHDGLSMCDDFLAALGDGSREYGESVQKKFLGWDEPCDEAAAEVEVARLAVSKRKAERDNSFSPFYWKLSLIVRGPRWYLESSSFKGKMCGERFLLPDFSGHMTSSLWGCCLFSAEYARRASLQKEFGEELKRIYERSSKDQTIKSRIIVLKEEAGLPKAI